VLYCFAYARGGHADPILVVFNLPGNAYQHICTCLNRKSATLIEHRKRG
jgi:hypothetical protein